MTHWYWVAFAHGAGFGACEVAGDGPITSGGDVERLNDSVREWYRKRLPYGATAGDIVVLTWTLLRVDGGDS